jgi:hypothetical protein
MEGELIINVYSLKAKDPPWDAVLMGSVASTINAKIIQKSIYCTGYLK